jgi:stage III sporulation protein AE
VGGTVSETYSTLISSLSLIKNTVGVFGIITVAVTVLPMLIQLLMWIISLEICLTLSDIMGAGSSVKMLSVLKDALILLVATITLVSTVFIVSVGVVITAKGGAL